MATLDIPFGATSNAKEVIEGVDLSGKRALVTGASSGIGVETSFRLGMQYRRLLLDAFPP